jgi:hypothetical protein
MARAQLIESESRLHLIEPSEPFPIRTRRVLHIGGFEAVEPMALDRRLARGLRGLSALWGVAATGSRPALSGDGKVISWTVAAQGGNWRTETVYTILRWDELIEPYTRPSWLRRTIRGYAALFEFLRNGTIGRYYENAAAYGYFAIFPFIAFAVFAGLSLIGGWLADGLGIAFPVLLAPVVGAVCLFALMRLVGRSINLEFSLNHWSFARDVVNRRVANFDSCIERFAGEIAAAIRNGGADEVIVSATSLGSVMAIEAMARALERDPQLCRRGQKVGLLTAGSSLLQIGLHPAAQAHRRAVERVAAENELFWLEVQSSVDAVNFYKTDPVTAMGLPPALRPTVLIVHIRNMLERKEYRRVRWSQLRIHRRYVMPNGVRYFYDYYLIVFGPLALPEFTALGDRAMTVFRADGSLGFDAVRRADRVPGVA